MPSTRYKGYALIDCNNFFVSCERVFKPHLNQKPLVVLSVNDGCIISRSNEVKNLGVPMGAPLFLYHDLLKKHQTSIFSSNFELYGDFSERVMQVIGLFSKDLEVYSIDEAFVPLTDQSEQDFSNLKKQILQWTGIPVSIGLGPTKTLAKAANYFAKKNQLSLFSLLNPLSHEEVLKSIDVSDIWGIGRKMTQKLHAFQIHSAFQFKEAQEEWIRRHFHLPGLRTALELKGISCSSKVEESRKSTMYSKSFGRPIETYQELKEAVSHYAAQAAYKIRKKGYLASMLSLYLKQKENVWVKTAPLDYPSDSTLIFLKTAQNLLKVSYQKGSYLKAGIYLSGLSSRKKEEQLHLFAPKKSKDDQLMPTIDFIQKKYGPKHLFFGGEGLNKDWATKNEHKSPLYTTRWKDLMTINI